MPTFSVRLESETTATGVTSDPVPAVVGIAITGAIAAVIFARPPSITA